MGDANKVAQSLLELADAIAQVEDAVLVVQGTGAGLEPMRARVAELGLTDRTHFMGWVPTEDLYSYTCGATVGTVFLDGIELSHQNAWPNRLFLYFMAGVVPAVTDLPGMSLIVDGESIGVKAAPRDSESMAQAIRWLIEHPEEREEMAARGRTLAETTYNWEVQSGRLLDLYERLT